MQAETLPADALARPASSPARNSVNNDWIRFGAWSGLIFSVMFMSIALVPMPDRLSTVIALLFPLFLLVGHVGLYHFLSQHRPAFTTQLAVIFGICAPVLVSAMLTAQMSLISYMERYYHPLDEVTKASQINIWRAVDSSKSAPRTTSLMF